jgi:hypothetical protein
MEWIFHYRDEESDSIPYVLLHGTDQVYIHFWCLDNDAKKKSKRIYSNGSTGLWFVGPFPNQNYSMLHYSFLKFLHVS